MKRGIYAVFSLMAIAVIYITKTELQNTTLTCLIGATICALAICIYFVKSRKAAQRRYREQIFQNHMRMTLKNHWH
jgi:hypothetical protein